MSGAWLGDLPDPGGERGEGAGEDVGDDEVVGGVIADGAVGEAGGGDGVDEVADAVVAGVVAGGVGGDGVDVAGDDRAMQAFGDGDGEDAGAGADVEGVAEAAVFQDAVDEFEAAGGGLVVAGAEGEGGLDADAG